VSLRLPHPFLLLLAGVVIAAGLTWVVPAGSYERRTDEATGREVVVPGTWRRVEPAPVGPLAAVVAVPRGIAAGAEVIIATLLVGGVIVLLDATGALARLVGSLVGRTRRPRLIVAGVCLGFATLGALENMHEEIIPLIPIMLVLSRGLGFGPVTALAMSVGSAVVGAAFGPTNPFQTAIALRFAGLPTLTMPGLRLGLLVVAVALWIGYTLAMASRDRAKGRVEAIATEPATRRDFVLLGIAVLPFIPYVIGVLKFDFGFNELSAVFLVSGLVLGVASGKSLNDTSAAYLKSMEPLLGAAMFIGVARAISVVFTDGRVIDTIIHGLAAPLDGLPPLAAAFGMVPVHALIHVPVVSVSGQAVLTMPIMAPLADLLSISRDSAVIAYQTGAGLMDMLTPTNGALLAMLLAAKVDYGRWVRFAVPGLLLIALVGLAGVAIAM
jgi:uncharacterized ion transporter superfamily protein YfcC